MIRIENDNYLLELTYKCFDIEDGKDWVDYDIYLFNKSENKVIYSTKGNYKFFDNAYPFVEFYIMDFYNLAEFMSKALLQKKKHIVWQSVEEEFGFEYFPQDNELYKIKFTLFEQRSDGKIVFGKEYTKIEIQELIDQFYQEHFSKNFGGRVE